MDKSKKFTEKQFTEKDNEELAKIGKQMGAKPDKPHWGEKDYFEYSEPIDFGSERKNNGLLIAGLITGSTGLGVGGVVAAGAATMGVEAGAAALAAMIGASTALATVLAVAIPAVLVAAGIGMLIGHAVQQGQQTGRTI